MTTSATHASTAAPSEELRVRLLLVLLAGLTLVAFWDVGHYEAYRRVAERLEGADEFFFSPTGASPGFVLGIAAYLLYHRRRGFLAAIGSPSRLWVGTPLLGLSIACAVWAHYTGAQHLVVAALGFFLIGAAETIGGAQATRAVLPSALLTFVLIPTPPTVFNSLMYELQLGIAAVSVDIVRLLGIESFQAGDRIVTKWGVFQVIESCTGLGTTETLLVTAPLYAAIFHRTDRRTVALVLLTPIVGLAANQLRVFSVVVGPYSDLHSVHQAQGLVFMVVGVLGIVLLDRLLERYGIFARRHTSGSPSGPPARPPSQSVAIWRIALCAGVALALVAARLPVSAWEPGAGSGESVERLRSLLKRIPSSGEEIDTMFLGSVRFSERLYRRYEHQGSQIGLFVATDDRANLGRSPYSLKTAVARSGWTVDRSWERDAPDGQIERAYLLHSPRYERRRLVVVRYGGIESPAVEALRYALALDRTRWRREDAAWVVRLDLPVGPESESIDEANEQLDAFFEEISPALGRVIGGFGSGAILDPRDS